MKKSKSVNFLVGINIMIKTRDGLWQVLVVLFSLIATLVQLKLSTLFLDSYFLGILALASIPLLLAMLYQISELQTILFTKLILR